MTQPSDWGALLDPRLLGLANAGLPGTIAMGLEDFRLTDEHNDTLMIRHGILPDPEKLSTYVIDLDYFSERRYALSPNLG